MRILLLNCFLGVTSLVVRAQQEKDSVRLVDIQSSECGGMYPIKPHFLGKETVGDTTFISLSCSNNCSGYHDPSVSLSGDSVLIHFGYGERVTRFKLLNGEYMDEEEINLHSKDSILEEVTEAIATCDCCYTFNLKILGLDPSKAYTYFYNKKFIDPNYKGPVVRKHFEFPYFLKKPRSEVCKKVKKIVSKDKRLLQPSKLFLLSVFLHVDTLDGSIKSVTTGFDRHSDKQLINKRLKEYFYSLEKIDCVVNPYTGRQIIDYKLFFEYFPEVGEMNMDFESRGPLIEDD